MEKDEKNEDLKIVSALTLKNPRELGMWNGDSFWGIEQFVCRLRGS